MAAERRYRIVKKDKSQFIETPRTREGKAWLNWMRIHDHNFHTKIREVMQENPALVPTYQIVNK